MELSTQQQAFYNKITSLDFDKILLTGEGGTGKTYVLVKALEALIDAGLNVLVCAPTHMARMNLLDKFSYEIRPRVQNKTVASALKRFGFKAQDGSLAFVPGTGDALDAYDVIAIDEVSMLSQKDLELFLKSKANIICTGDPQQLPVVKEKKANLSVFSTDFEHFHLDEQMRQQGAIYHLAQRSREVIYVPQREDMNEEAGLFMVDSEAELIEKLISGLIESEGQVWRHRYLCHSNIEAYRVNAQARAALFPHETEAYVRGEWVMLGQTCKVGYNAEMVNISHVEKRDIPAWDAEAYELYTNGSFILTFSQGTWLRIEEKINTMREAIADLRKNKHFDAMNMYLNEIKYIEENFVRVYYPYATTVHKSQGQTIDHVYLNTLSIDKATNKRALMYVGISRASESLTVVEVPLRAWQHQRQVNREYKIGRKMYEDVYGEKYYRLRDRFPHPCTTLEDKEYWSWMFKANAMIPMAMKSIIKVRFH